MKLFCYNGQDVLIGILEGTGTVDQEINVYDQFDAQITRNEHNLSIIHDAFSIGVETAKGVFQLFKVATANLLSNPIELTAVESASDDLDTRHIIIDRRFENQKLSDVLPSVFEGTGWEYTFSADDTVDTINFYRESSKSALKKVEDTWPIEVRFTYEVAGNKISKRICHIKKHIGTDTHVRLVQGKNIDHVDYTQDQTEMYTAAIGRGGSVPMTDEDGQETGGYSRLVEFDDVVWSKASGNPVDKPAGQKYVEIPEATEQFGWLDGDKRKPRIAVWEFDDEQDPNHLLELTYQKLLEHTKPNVAVETTVGKIGDQAALNLGDTVDIVIYQPYKLHYQARVTKMVRHLDNPSATEITVGTQTWQRQAEREMALSEQVDSTQDQIDDVKDSVEDTKKETEEKLAGQEERAQQAIQEMENKVNKKIDDTKQTISDFVNRNSANSPLQFYDANGNIIQGIPPVAYIKSRDGNFILNASGFNWDGRLLGGNGALYADDIVGKSITGYDITGAHISGGTITGVTITGQVYINSQGSGGSAVMSGDYGFSFGDSALGSGTLRLGSQWLTEDMLKTIKKKAGLPT